MDVFGHRCQILSDLFCREPQNVTQVINCHFNSKSELSPKIEPTKMLSAGKAISDSNSIGSTGDGYLSIRNKVLRKSLAKKKLPVDNLLNTFREILCRTCLKNVTTNPSFQCLGNIVVIAMDGQDNGSSSRNDVMNSARRLNPIQTGH